MEIASRIASILLGLAVAVFILWPVTIPVGFGEAWWGSKQVATTSEFAAARPSPSPSLSVAEPAQPVAPPAPPPAKAVETGPPDTATHAMSPTPDAAKHTLLASEKAEAERIAALSSKEAKDAKDTTGATRQSPPTKLYYRVTVRDGGTLQSGDVVIRLAGVLARDADATCKDRKGRTWRCGAAARSALAHLIHARAIACELPELPKAGRPKDFAARCAVAGTDLSTWLVRQGWATPTDPADPALAEAAEAAKKEGVGLWRAGDANGTREPKNR
jgi:endonuclease YncB( thermonuclease family)